MRAYPFAAALIMGILGFASAGSAFISLAVFGAEQAVEVKIPVAGFVIFASLMAGAATVILISNRLARWVVKHDFTHLTNSTTTTTRKEPESH